ncbi:DNA glycosylase AlkZ-like family protein [Haloarchaeobius amylolyticus]|uniref:DNA glycosylase AlkZ-like family protein n=1 Tax=Haloarchaeobius amylolyticus TaxID=1198296 RepID=UPI0034A52BCA
MCAGWAAIEDETTAVSESQKPLRVFEEDCPSEIDHYLRLLPAFESYLLGYETREFAISAVNEAHVWPGGGIIRPTVVADGTVIGTWKLDTTRTHAHVDVTPFDNIPTAFEGALRAEIDDIKRFLVPE